MTAVTAYEVSTKMKDAAIVRSIDRTYAYIETVLYAQIDRAARMGEDRLVHIVPSKKLDRWQIVRVLRSEDFRVCYIGRLLIIEW